MPISEIPNVRNRVKERLAAGELALALGVRLARTVDIAMIAAACGFDALYIDMEHGTLDLGTIGQICGAALPLGIASIVRVPPYLREEAPRILDCGALGMSFSHIQSGEEAQAIVDLCKFAPLGHRSPAGTGPSMLYRSMQVAEMNTLSNEITFCIAVLETPEAIANANSIAAVPGIDILSLGSNDLSTALGIPGQVRHPRMRAAYEAVAAACRDHGKTFTANARGRDHIQELIGLGARFVIAGGDVGLLMAAARAEADALRSLTL